MSVAGVNGMAVAAVAGGALLLWSGIKGTSPVKGLSNILTGQAPPTTQTEGLQGTGSTGDPVLAASTTGASTGSKTVASSGAAGAAGGSASTNQAIAKLLWNSESSWSNTIWNTSASCGGDAYAFGIPQACGHGVRKAIPGHGGVCPFPAGNAGNPPQCGGSNNASAQISWGLAYIKANYGSPVHVPHGGY